MIIKEAIWFKSVTEVEFIIADINDFRQSTILSEFSFTDIGKFVLGLGAAISMGVDYNPLKLTHNFIVFGHFDHEQHREYEKYAMLNKLSGE